MNAIRLKNPNPREKEIPYKEVEYSILETIYLPVPENLPKKSFSEVLEARRTYRQFDCLPLDKLSNLLWLSSRTRERKKEDSGFVWQHRNVPSAGGRHPIDILVQGINLDYETLWLYNSLSHSIARLKINIPELSTLSNITEQIIPIQKTTIIWFVAQIGRTLSKYAKTGACRTVKPE